MLFSGFRISWTNSRVVGCAGLVDSLLSAWGAQVSPSPSRDNQNANDKNQNESTWNQPPGDVHTI